MFIPAFIFLREFIIKPKLKLYSSRWNSSIISIPIQNNISVTHGNSKEKGKKKNVFNYLSIFLTLSSIKI